MDAISMRELQKLSADKIRNLPHAIPIRCGGDTVGILSPVRKPDQTRLLAALRRLEEEPLELTGDELDRARRLVGELDLE